MVDLPVNAFLLIGPTGVGKSPLGDVVAKNGLIGRRCRHLDFGSELRRAVSAQSASCTERELDFIRGVLERGLLLENEHFPLAEKIISLFLERVCFSREELLVLNGIPRHQGQARDIGNIARVHGVILLDCSAEEVFLRIRTNAGGDRAERTDDSIEMIQKKLRIFRERTDPLVRYYEEKECPVYRVSVTAMMTSAEAFAELSSLAAVHPPVSLVTEPPKR